MTADHFRDLIGVVAQRDWKNDTTHKDWDRVYAYLADAHKQKVYDERRRALQAAREAKDKKDGKGGFEAACFTPRSARTQRRPPPLPWTGSRISSRPTTTFSCKGSPPANRPT